VKPVQAAAAAKTANILHGIGGFRSFLANPDEFPHRLHPLVPPAKVALANGLPHELRNGGLPAPGASAKNIPEGIVKI